MLTSYKSMSWWILSVYIDLLVDSDYVSHTCVWVRNKTCMWNRKEICMWNRKRNHKKKKKIHWNILDVNLPLHLYTENIPTRYFTATGSHAHIHIYVVRFQDARPLTGTKIDLPLRYYAVFILTQNIIEIYQNKAFICGVVLFFAS